METETHYSFLQKENNMTAKNMCLFLLHKTKSDCSQNSSILRMGRNVPNLPSHRHVIATAIYATGKKSNIKQSFETKY